MRAALLRSFLLVLAGPALAGAGEVAYPDGYRDWNHVKSMVIGPGHPLYEAFGGIHHIYANPPALEGYRSGTFPDGAVIVFDLLATEEADGAIVEGGRKVVGVMVRDQPAHAATGGWGFEAFSGDSTSERLVGGNAAEACFACHEAQATPDFVFSTLRP